MGSYSAFGGEEVRTRVYDPHGAGVPTLIAFAQNGHIGDFPITQDCVIVRAGCAGDVELVPGERAIELPAAIVSRRHGKVGVSSGRCFYRDEGSTHGTLLNGKTCEGVVELQQGDALGFAPGGAEPSLMVKLVFAQTVRGRLYWNRIKLGDDVAAISIGRSDGNGGLAFSDEFLSRRHALFVLEQGEGSACMRVEDAGSTNGVFVNGCRIEGSTPVDYFDVVRIGNTWAVRLADELWVGSDYPAYTSMEAARKVRAVEPQGVGGMSGSQPFCFEGGGEGSCANGPNDADEALLVGSPESPSSAVFASKAADNGEGCSPVSSDGEVDRALLIDIRERSVADGSQRKTLLKDVRLRVDPGDFVLVLGGSGAGKTTLLNAVMGNDKADGSVRYGELDVYEDYDQIKYDIGYVPQKDLVRLNDTVYYTLFSSAQLRMPARSTRAECRARAEWAADMLGLSPEMDTIVGNLSGGQLKRLSSAIELVGDPALFFLDEPDSGLDGMMSRSLMNNLKSIADLGKIVIVITHGPDRAAHLFTKVLVLAKSEREGSGQMAFFGTVAEAKEYFGTDTLEGIISKINRHDEGGEGLADFFIEKWKEVRR